MTEVWSPRQVEPLGRVHAAGLDLKAYGILVDSSRALGHELTDAAHAVLDAGAGEVAETDHQGLGFTILHRGEEGIWLLLHWWLKGSILGQLLWRADLAGHPEFQRRDRPLMACVWELALIDHERRCWTHTMMTVKPNPAAYLDDWFPHGFC